MPEPRTIELISAHELASAAYTYGYRLASPHFTPGEKMAAQQRVRALLLAETSDPLPRARAVVPLVAELDALDLAHPGLWSQEQVREERERLLGEIGRLMGSKC